MDFQTYKKKDEELKNLLYKYYYYLSQLNKKINYCSNDFLNYETMFKTIHNTVDDMDEMNKNLNFYTNLLKELEPKIKQLSKELQKE